MRVTTLRSRPVAAPVAALVSTWWHGGRGRTREFVAGAPSLIGSMARRGLLAVRAALAVLAALLMGALAPATAGAARSAQAQSPPPKAYIVVDVDTGTVLLSSNEHEALPPASTAKVMTALTAFERLAPDALIGVSPLAAAQPASRINMAAGQQWRFADALASLLMASANDAAYAIAEAAGGSLDGFVVAMDQSAERMGMQDSTFADPAGLDDDQSFGGGPRMSAYDIAIATRNAAAVPEIARWAGLRSYEFVDPTGLERSLTNHNKFLPGGSRAYQWATGFKTGFTERAGHTLTATATRDGRSLIAVVLNTYDTYGWAAQLLEQAFATPNAAGTGARLPEVTVSLFADRLADQQAFATVVRGAQTTTLAAPTVPGTGTDTTTGSNGTAATAAPRTPSSRVGADTIVSEEPADDSGGGGFGSIWLIVVVVLVLVALVFVLRRRVVRRQRARRIARQRLRAAKMRSGGLPVVDGRYRTEDRTGPPIDSHVRIRRDDE
jgi:D-alanyl-D-alanine carboxypeptidase